jgi:RNA polymerase sigma factor (sigma-70 family)
VRGGTSRKCPFVGNYSLKLRLPIIYPNSRRIEQRKRPILCDLLVCEGDSGGITHAFPLHALVGEKVGYNRVGERTMEAHCEYLSTDDLVLRAQQGDERAAEQVLALFRPLAQNLAGRFYMPSCDPEDVYQVALIGLWRAVQCFDPRRKAGFAAFARVCIRRQILSELKRAQRWASADRQPFGRGGRALVAGAVARPAPELVRATQRARNNAAAARVFGDETQPAGSASNCFVSAAPYLPRDCGANRMLAKIGGQRAGSNQAQGIPPHLREPLNRAYSRIAHTTRIAPA